MTTIHIDHRPYTFEETDDFERGVAEGMILSLHVASCDNPDCPRHGDAMFCEACERWVADPEAECPALSA